MYYKQRFSLIFIQSTTTIFVQKQHSSGRKSNDINKEKRIILITKSIKNSNKQLEWRTEPLVSSLTMCLMRS